MSSVRATPGYKGEIKVDDVVMAGVYDVSQDFGTEEIDSSAFGDEYEQTVSGLGNAELSVSAIYTDDDTALNSVFQASQPGDDPQVDVTYKPDASQALEFSFAARVDSVTVNQDVSDRVEVDITFQLAEGVLTIATV